MRRLINKLRGWRRAPADISAALDRGWQELRTGQINVAERTLFDLAGSGDTDNVGVARLRTGIVAIKLGLEAAKALLNEMPDRAEKTKLYADLGDLFVSQQRVEEAESAYRTSLEIDPTHSQAGRGLMLLLVGAGLQMHALAVFSRLTPGGAYYFEAARAASEIQRALGRPLLAINILLNCAEHSECPEEIAVDLLRSYATDGDHTAATDFARRWLTSRASANHVRHVLGSLLFKAGQFAEAKSLLQHVVNITPDNATALNDFGCVQRALGEFDTALENFELAVHHDPTDSTARINLIAELERGNHLTQAREECRILQKDHPGNPSAWFWDGKLSERLGEFDRAAAAYERAAELSPQNASIWTNLGLVYQQQGLNAKALACQQKALSIAPLDAAVHLNLGCALQSAGDIGGALASYSQSRVLDSSDDITLLHIGIAQLTAGDFAQGWEGYEMRWLRETAVRRSAAAPKWAGESLRDKNLLVWGEQGLGDQIMFASCVPDLAHAASECVVECDARLAPLFRRSFPDCRIVAGHTQQNLDTLCSQHRFDFQSPIGSLPRYTRRSWSHFPDHRSYLRADHDAKLEWRHRLSHLPGKLKVGLSWIGGVPVTRRHLRSQTLLSWAPFLTQPNVSFISLQYTDCAREIAETGERLGVDIGHWQDAIDDLDQTAALISELDLVISVCTTVVHLAGALGVRTWVMTPATPEWRYLTCGSAMPWYPMISLVRQPVLLDWADPIEEIRRRLALETSVK